MAGMACRPHKRAGRCQQQACLDTVGNVMVEIFGAEAVLYDASDLRILIRRELMLNVDLHALED